MAAIQRLPTRTCGECTLCCTAVAAFQLGKPTGQTCPHVGASGCQIYDIRPLECRSFRCIWLNGFFAESDRPDKIGAVFFEETTYDGTTIVTVNEAHPGATAESRRAKELLRTLLEMGLTVVVRNENRIAKLTPNGEVEKFDVDPSDPLKVRALSYCRCANAR